MTQVRIFDLGYNVVHYNFSRFCAMKMKELFPNAVGSCMCFLLLLCIENYKQVRLSNSNTQTLRFQLRSASKVNQVNSIGTMNRFKTQVAEAIPVSA